MVDHLVLLKVRESATSEQIETMLSGIRDLEARFDSISELTCGATNTTEHAQGYNYGLYARFDSQESIDAYMADAEHVKMIETSIMPIIDGLVIVDIPV